MLDPTMSRVVGQQCCVRLQGPLSQPVIAGGGELPLLVAVHLFL